MAHAAKTKLDAVDEYVVFDTETTGLDATWCEIIEVSALKVKDGKIVDRFSTLVKPKELPIPEFITDLTGISNDMLIDAPRIEDVAPKLSDFMQNYVLVGHNVCFDAKFVSAAFGRELENDLVDTMRISRHVNKSLQSHKLVNVYNYCVSEGAPLIEGDSHRAEFDAEETLIAYEHMKPKLIALYGDNPEEGWRKSSSSNKHYSKTKKGDVVQTVEDIDDSNPFYGMHVCFTGKLESMVRAEAWQKLVNLGGIIEENAVEKLDYLVIGNAGFVSGVKGNKSDKIKKAEANQLKGLPVQIISENFFMEFAKDV